jgi:hypothetical protein
MTCRHAVGDPNCSSHPDNVRAAERLLVEERARQGLTPDASSYEVVDFLRVGPHVVMKVLYPNCAKCSYEGHKVLVLLDVTEADVLGWRKIDPHFRDPKSVARNRREAPSPVARFPASAEGWKDAQEYASRKSRERT